MKFKAFKESKDHLGNIVWDEYELSKNNEWEPTGWQYRTKGAPKGYHQIIGTDRDGNIQLMFEGTGNTTFVGSVFTFGFLANANLGGCVTYSEITWDEFNKYQERIDNIWYNQSTDLERYVNFMGHDDTAKLCGMEKDRITVRAHPGDKIVWAQYSGPRLEEGATTLPEGAKLIPMKAEIFDNRINKLIHDMIKIFK